jgi:hypothetical protein
MTLELLSEIVAGLETLASAHGLSVQDYLRELVERELPASEPHEANAEGGIRMVDGLPIYYSSCPLPNDFIEKAIERSREDRVRHLLGQDF